MSREIHPNHRMGGSDGSRGVDVAVATLATRQQGVVEHAQLLALQLSPREIERRIAAGRLHPLHRGVYAVGHRHLTRNGRYMAAVLAAGDGAVLSHASAADLWGLRRAKEAQIDVIPRTHRAGDDDLRTHRARLDESEVTTRQGIPVTTPLRTILDIAAQIPRRELERAIRRAEYEHLATTARLAEAAESRRGRRGMKALREALIHLGATPGFTRSELEDRFLRLLRRHRLPPPELNVQMQIARRAIEADCVWREQRVIIELDGRDAHDNPPAFERDRSRDLALAAAGWRPGRVTSARLRFDQAALASELRALLL